MDRNFFLALALSFAVLTLWTYMKAPSEGSSQQPPEATPVQGSPGDAASFYSEEGTGDPLESAAPTLAPSEVPSEPEPVEPGRRFVVETDLYESVWSDIGGGLSEWNLLQYFDEREEPRRRIPLVTPNLRVPVALATPLEGLGFGDLSASRYHVSQTGPLALEFELERSGVVVRKRFRFEEGSYVVHLAFEIENQGDRHIRPTFKLRWPVEPLPIPDYRELSLVAWHDGGPETGLLGSKGGFLGFGGPLDEVREFIGDVRWAGAQLRYFVSAMIPERARDASARFVPMAGGRVGVSELAFQPVDVPPGQSATQNLRLYIGPKEAQRLDAVGAQMGDAIPKGWFAPLTSFFIWLLDAAYRAIPNYGLAIIVITVLVRLLMAPILAKQMKSMKRMGELSPRMKEIQEKYSDDKQKQSEEMMKMYKETGFNPLAGCLPMLLQLPVFIGLYYALQGTIDLRQAPFVAWIQDLSAPETLWTVPGLDFPIRVLPLLMGGSMILQTSMTPTTTMDPAQARMMKWMLPSVFTVMFYQFASGLVLYWLVSNVLGILQQWYTNRHST